MGYIIGLFKYIINSALKNTYAMLVFGGATLGLIFLVDELARGKPLAGLIAYIMNKYLPPLTVKSFITVLTVGCVWAGLKWYWKVPRR
jgi:hypothetical protein